MNNKNKAFTLVELISVMTILIIIGIIGFISFISYLKTARDLSRKVEFTNIESSLNSYIIKAGFYPIPGDPVEIYYSGGLVWIQGTFNNQIANMIGYSNDVVDPLTNNLYTYSVKNSRKEFSIAGVLEEQQTFVLNNGIIGDTYAAKIGKTVGTALISGNFNGELISINNGATNYILALPSIVTSDLSSNDLMDILNNNKLVYNNFENLPYSYTGTIYKTDANLDFSTNNLVVFSGAISELKKSYNQVKLLKDLHDAYSGSILGKNISVNKIDSADLLSINPSRRINIQACDLINYKLKYFVECGGIDFITFYVMNILHIDISNLPGDLISVYETSEGNFIFGTEEGVAFYDGTNWIIYDEHNSDLNQVDEEVSFITELSPGFYLFGTEDGVITLDIGADLASRVDDIWTVITDEEHDIINDSNYQYIYTLNDGSIWVGMNGELIQFDDDAWSNYINSSESRADSAKDITIIYSDSNNNVWFGIDEDEGGGIDKYNLTTGQVTHYANGVLDDDDDDFEEGENDENNEVEYILEDSSNRIWVGTDDEGLTWTDDSGLHWTDIIYPTIPNNKIQYLFEDSQSNVWVGTDGGLAKYNGSSWTIYKTPEILSNDINFIYEDNSGNMRILSDGGLDTIDSLGNVITP